LCCHPHACPAGALHRNHVAVCHASSPRRWIHDTVRSILARLIDRSARVSPLFAHRRALAEASGVPWFVVSGRWGLLDPGNFLAPYSFSFKEQSVSYRRAWGLWGSEIRNQAWSAVFWW